MKTKTKKCSDCQLPKILTDFCKNKSHKDGRHHMCKECHNRRSSIYQKEHGNPRMERYRRKLKNEVFSHYGGPICAHCGLTAEAALSIDHIAGGGNKHRKEIGAPSHSFYVWLRKNGFPPGFQVLCMSCQFIKKEKGNHLLAQSQK